MRSFEYHNPCRVIFGPGKVNTLTEKIEMIRQEGLWGENCLVIYGSERVVESGLIDRVETGLQTAGCKVSYFGGIRPNPRLSTLKKAIARALDIGADCVLALGGGSVMDMAKAVAAGIKYPGDAWDMVFHGQKDYRPPSRALPVIAIPTLAATGSETDPIAVITNEETRQKSFIRSAALFPRLSILDPELTVSVPPIQTAYGVADMISHVTESYFNGPGETPLQDGMAETIVKVALEYGKRAVHNGSDLEARKQLQWASAIALSGIVQAGADGPFVVHALEHILSAWYDIPHGAGLAVLNPAWMLWAAMGNPGKFAFFARQVLGVTAHDDAKAVSMGVTVLKKRFRELGLPVTLQELGVPKADWSELADSVLKTVGQKTETGVKVLPAIRPMDRDAILEVFVLASQESKAWE